MVRVLVVFLKLIFAALFTSSSSIYTSVSHEPMICNLPLVGAAPIPTLPALRFRICAALSQLQCVSHPHPLTHETTRLVL